VHAEHATRKENAMNLAITTGPFLASELQPVFFQDGCKNSRDRIDCLGDQDNLKGACK